MDALFLCLSLPLLPPPLTIYTTFCRFFLRSLANTNKNCGNYIKGSTLAQHRDILLSFAAKKSNQKCVGSVCTTWKYHLK